MANRIKLEGKTFSKLYVNEYIGRGKYKCTCECNNTVIADGQKLRTGSTKACKQCSGTGPIDISNQVFGEWTALYYTQNGFWYCRCSCGIEREVDGMRLRNGSSTNCGHIRDKNNLIDLTGKQFGEWNVLKHIKNDLWECKCSCGTIKSVRSTYLRSGASKSCGHKHSKLLDLSQQRFGKLVVNKYIKSENKWECTCDCGNTTKVYSANLRSGDTTSCGCEAHKYKVSKEQLLSFINKVDKFHIQDIMRAFDVSEKTARDLIKLYNLEYKLDRTFGSIYEKDIYEYIKNYTNNIILHNRSVLKGLEIDIYLPDYNIAIEINGDYWHSTVFKTEYYHQQKTIACAKKGIRLIHIFEYEIINNREKIYNFLNNILNTSEKIYANKTKVEEIDTEIYRRFIEKYHLSGYANAQIKLGLFFNNTIIGVAAFDKPRFTDKYDYELIRLAYKNNIKVVGGTEKLLKAFIKKYNPKSILSYCDITKFNGDAYIRCGFTYINITKPNYVWVDILGGHNVLSRYKVQELVKESGIPEDNMMLNNGYYKIYNSGNLKFILDIGGN